MTVVNHTGIVSVFLFNNTVQQTHWPKKSSKLKIAKEKQKIKIFVIALEQINMCKDETTESLFFYFIGPAIN